MRAFSGGAFDVLHGLRNVVLVVAWEVAKRLDDGNAEGHGGLRP